jgi:ElaB/YqjD/DUF883 family membrane-anchored ribosome-binding protein
MAAKDQESFVGSLREGAIDAGGRLQEAVAAMAGKIEDSLEDAKYEGRHMKRKVQAELVRRWKAVDRVGRDNAFLMALGALGVGIAVGYLLGRDRD